MHHCVKNDLGGITYAASRAFGAPDRRRDCLADLRMAVDGLAELGDKIMERWPDGVDMPLDLKAMLHFKDFVIARVRSGTLKRMAEVIDHE